MKQLLFVDDEPRVLQGLQRQLRGMRQEWQMDFVESGAKALEFMAATHVDVVVTDMMMRGMDGAQLLNEVRNQYPNTIRLVLSGHSDVESVLKLVGPAHQYLSKPCEDGELRNAVARAFALRDLLSNEQIKGLATRLCTLPALPTNLLALTKELQQEDPSMERVSQLIYQDLGMTSKILQLVNSAFFGLAQPITQMDQAILYLGLTTVRALVLSLQIFSQFEQKTIKGFSIDKLAWHGWQVGTLARKIAQSEHAGLKCEDQCFLAGLLHDVGQLVLASSLPETYERVLTTMQEEKVAQCEAERAELGATHAEVGGYLLALWGLPTPVVEAVCLHHRPADSIQRGFSPVIAVHVANVISHNLKNDGNDSGGNQIDTAYLTELGLAQRVDKWKLRCSENQTNETA